MEIHKPKPVHSWRGLLSEIGIIVIGVTIALGGEQLVEEIRWKHKVTDAEGAMRSELGLDLAFAASQLAMKDCAKQYLTRLEAAIRDRGTGQLRQLAAMDSPFSSVLFTHPWRVDSWTAAISSEIPNHIPRDKLSAYAFAFRMIATQRERQFIIVDHYAEVVGARLVDVPTPEISYAQLVALDEMKANHELMLRISAAFLGNLAKELDIAPNPQALADQADEPARCEKQLAAIAP
jgi:hypothetical protein